MKNVELLEYVSGYDQRKPKTTWRFLIWVALALHAAALVGLVVVPLMQVDRDVPRFESMATFSSLEQAAIDAVRQWRSSPYVMLDKAVPFWVTVTVNVRLT